MTVRNCLKNNWVGKGFQSRIQYSQVIDLSQISENKWNPSKQDANITGILSRLNMVAGSNSTFLYTCIHNTFFTENPSKLDILSGPKRFWLIRFHCTTNLLFYNETFLNPPCYSPNKKILHTKNTLFPPWYCLTIKITYTKVVFGCLERLCNREKILRCFHLFCKESTCASVPILSNNKLYDIMVNIVAKKSFLPCLMHIHENKMSEFSHGIICSVTEANTVDVDKMSCC